MAIPYPHKHLLLLVLWFASCVGGGALKSESGPESEHCITQSPSYAKNFAITRFPTHRIITAQTIQANSALRSQYALVPRDSPLPELPEDITVIRTPVERVVVLETVHLGYLEALDKLDTIIGAANTNYISNEFIRERVKDGSVRQVQIGTSLNIERLLLQKPDLILTSIPTDQSAGISTRLLHAGLPVVLTTEYKEQHLLARAEWIKFIAEFFDATATANEYFTRIAARYESLCSKVSNVRTRPTVFCGAPYSGIWHIARGESYIAQAIKDAGGHYLWENVPGSDVIPLDTERVFLKAARADVWINPSFYRSLNALFGADPRFQKFHATRMGKVYNNTRQQRNDTGNPIWETGVVHPDNVLADLIKIFHPDRMPDWEFSYYEQLQ